MAGLKKKKQEKSGSPNIVLVIFLVFFFLLSIGLGVWGYYGYAGQEDLRRARDAAAAKEKGENLATKYWRLLYKDLRVGIGADDLKGDELEPGERKDFLSDGYGPFKEEKDNESAKKLMDDIRARLPVSDKEGYGNESLFKQLDFYKKKAKDWEGTAANLAAANKRYEKFEADMTAKNTTFQGNMKTLIENNNTKQLNEIKRPAKDFEELQAQLRVNEADLTKSLTDLSNLKEAHQEALIAKEKELASAKRELAKALASTGAGQPIGGAKGGGRTFPLVLDISPGKPFWDYYVGKIKSVNMELRQVVIDIGADQGAKPELTFNIFGANTGGRGAIGQMKGTIEIIKVNPTNSLCRITSLYDAEGREVLLQGRTRFQVQRETETALREGDLLYNLFWNTHVAVAGNVSLTGETTKNPAEQKRQLDDFMHLLDRNGMKVDAYVDMRDGKIVGAISSQTRYLIIRAADLEGVSDEKPKADDEKPKEAAPNADRSAAITKSIQTLRDQAKDFGLLQISVENFVVVIGYRKARSANSEGPTANFRPSLPDAGTGQIQANRDEPARDQPPEKKAPDMEKDKKDN